MSNNQSDVAEAIADQMLHELAALEERIDRLQQPAVAELQSIINRYHGRTFGSFARNKEVAARVQRVLDRLDLKVKCPKTGKLGTLRCKSAGGSKYGCFEVRIYVDGKRTAAFSSTTWHRFDIVREGDYLGNRLDLQAG